MTDERDSAVWLLALAKTCETLAQSVCDSTRLEGEELTSLVEKAGDAVKAVALHIGKKIRVFRRLILGEQT